MPPKMHANSIHFSIKYLLLWRPTYFQRLLCHCIKDWSIEKLVCNLYWNVANQGYRKEEITNYSYCTFTYICISMSIIVPHSHDTNLNSKCNTHSEHRIRDIFSFFSSAFDNLFPCKRIAININVTNILPFSTETSKTYLK